MCWRGGPWKRYRRSHCSETAKTSRRRLSQKIGSASACLLPVPKRRNVEEPWIGNLAIAPTIMPLNFLVAGRLGPAVRTDESPAVGVIADGCQAATSRNT